MARTDKILVARGGALGDFILTLPVLTALRRHYPDRPLEILGLPGIAALAVAGGLADRVSALDSPELANFFMANGSLPEKCASYFSQFETIVSFLYDPEKVFQRNVARCSAAQFIVGAHRPDETSNRHATEVFLEALKELGIYDADTQPRLPLSASELPKGRWFAIHPGSGGERKNWAEANWAQLLKILAAETDLNFLLIGGEAEGERVARLAAKLPPGRFSIAQDLPLVELAGRMKGCAAFAGHDSGITHLAAAIDLPGIVLWGETSEAVWSPRNEKMKILRNLNRLDAPMVMAAARELLRHRENAGLPPNQPAPPGS